MAVTTCLAEEAPKGTKLTFEPSGQLKDKAVVAAQRGTIVSVEKLFHNLPVRRRELERNIKREWQKVIALLNQYACIQTNLKFSVSQQPTKGRRISLFSTKGNPTTRDNIINIFGAKTLTGLLPLDLTLEMKPTALGSALQSGSDGTDPSTISTRVRVLGHVSRPTHGEGRQTPDRQMFFVNGRPCSLPQFAKVFNEVYRSYNSSQVPFILADIQLDTHMYDVNVSPDKRSILLHDQNHLLESVRSTLVDLFDTQDHTVPVSQLMRTPKVAFQSTRQTPTPQTISGGEVGTTPSTQAAAGSSSQTPSRPSRGRERTQPEKPSYFEQWLAKADPETMQDVDSNLLDDSGSPGSTAPSPTSTPEKPQEVPDRTALKRQVAPTSMAGGDDMSKEDQRPLKRVHLAEGSQVARSDGPSSVDDTNRHTKFLAVLNGQSTTWKGSTRVERKEDSEDEEQEVEMKELSVDEVEDVNHRDEEDEQADEEEEEEDEGEEGQESDEEKVRESARGDEILHVGVIDQKDMISPTSTPEALDCQHDDGTSKDTRAASESDKGGMAGETVRFPQKDNPGQQPRVTSRRKGAAMHLVHQLSIDDDGLQLKMGHWVELGSRGNSKAPDSRQVEDIAAPDAESKLPLIIAKSDFSKMRVAGQFNLGFIIAVRPGTNAGGLLAGSSDELFIIDQHASDEKYNFERLQDTTIVQSQRLVLPKQLELTALEEEVVMQSMEAIEANGFKIDTDFEGAAPVGTRCQLTALPLSRETTFSLADLEELIALLGDESLESRTIPRPSKVRKMFAMRACRSSIMIGKPLTQRQMYTLVNHMGELDKPWNCPHGRPTMRHLCQLDTWSSIGWNRDRDTISPASWASFGLG